MAKHVIFLGAGASYTSGYPLAAELRQILSSSEAFQNYIGSKFNDSVLTDLILKKFNEYEGLIHLFRKGGFGTIDEFSFLSRGRYKDGVQTLKLFLSLIFASHCPELPYQKTGGRSGEKTTAFESSDYFPFIQKLFNEDFHELKNDIAILTYNYDPYFEFVLDRAYETRKQAAGTSERHHSSTTFFSGFSDRRAEVLRDNFGFCFLKLHGTSVLPKFDSPNHLHEFALTYDDVLLNRKELNEKFLKKITQVSPSLGVKNGIDFLLAPPILFPWEIMTDDGVFVTEDNFRLFEGMAASADKRFPEGSFYSVLKAVWLRAKAEIADAEKISFVGLSMHDFLKPGLRYLFSERVDKYNAKKITHNLDYTLEIVLACPGAWHRGETFQSQARPNSPAAKLAKMLHDVNPNMAGKIKGQINSRDSGKNAVGGIICYDDFKSFIEAEM